MASIALPVGFNALLQLKNFQPESKNSKPEKTRGSKISYSIFFLIVFAVVAALPSWCQQNMVTFIPKYLSDLGKTPGTYGLFSALYMAGFASGNLAGGFLADKFGKKRVAMFMFVIASIPILLIPILGWTLWLYILIPLSGFFTGATFSIIVVLAQNILPGGRGFTSGLILGFVFSSGAIGTMLSGYLADLKGIGTVFTASAGLMLLAAVLTYGLRRMESQPSQIRA